MTINLIKKHAISILLFILICCFFDSKVVFIKSAFAEDTNKSSYTIFDKIKKLFSFGNDEFKNKSFKLNGYDIPINVGKEYLSFDTKSVKKIELSNLRSNYLIHILATKKLISSIHYSQKKGADKLFILLNQGAKNEDLFYVKLDKKSVIDSQVTVLNGIFKNLVSQHSLNINDSKQVLVIKNLYQKFITILKEHSKLSMYKKGSGPITLNPKYEKSSDDVSNFMNFKVLKNEITPMQFAAFIKGYFETKRNEVIFGNKYYEMSNHEFGINNVKEKDREVSIDKHISELDELILNFHILLYSELNN